MPEAKSGKMYSVEFSYRVRRACHVDGMIRHGATQLDPRARTEGAWRLSVWRQADVKFADDVATLVRIHPAVTKVDASAASMSSPKPRE